MMRFFFVVEGFLLLLFPLIGFASLPAQGAGARLDETTLHAFITAQMQMGHIPGLALSVVQGNRVVYQQGYGRADDKGRVVTPQTPFIIGSTTKSFTALALMQLVEQGKVEIDAPVQRYLPWFRVADPVASAKITLRELLYHTSGLPAFAEPNSVVDPTLTLEQEIRNLRSASLDRPVGSYFEYSNVNYHILGLIVQTISGEPYATYIKQHIFAPLDMHQSFTSQQEAQSAGLTQGYTWLFGLPRPVATPVSPSNLPSGFLISSANDLSHYLIAQMNAGHWNITALLSAQGIAAMHASGVTYGDSDNMGYGMGWQVSAFGGVQAIWHTGTVTGFNSLLLMDPARHWGVAMLININSPLVSLFSGIDPVERVEEGVVRLLAGMAPQPSTGMDVTGFYLIIDAILLLFSLPVIGSLCRLPHWHKKLTQRAITRQRWGWRLALVGLRLAWEILPPLLFFISLPFLVQLSWPTLLAGVQIELPDIGAWFLVMGFLTLITGLIRAVLLLLVLRRHKPLTARSDAIPTAAQT